MIKRTTLLVAGMLLVSNVATAGSNWQTFTFSTTPTDQPKVLAAAEKLMAAAGPGDKGTVSLMANVAGGDHSHMFVSSFDSRAAREMWAKNFLASPAWKEFTKTTSGLIERGQSSRMNLVKSWGEQSSKDVFWEIYAFTVTDADDFSEAIDDFLASDTGKTSPGRVHLSAVAAAGLSQVTHLISVGFESEAQAETWEDLIADSKDFEKYQKASREVSTFAGAFMSRTMQTWGSSGD